MGNHLTVNNLHKNFFTPGGREIKALKGLSFGIDKGSILSIVGHNGSGKTTLLNCLRQSITWDKGEIFIEEQPLGKDSTKIVSVFQDVGFGVVGSMTPLENLSLTFSQRKKFNWVFPHQYYKEKIYHFLDKTGLRQRFDAFENTPVAELSGGQRQQVAILMAIMRQPKLLLLDEFVTNLDPEIRNEVLLWVKEWIREHQVTTLMVTHDHDLAKQWGDWILELSDGNCVRFEAT